VAKTIILLLGNGFTIDFLHSVNKTNEIDVRNLFRYGSHVPWPTNREPGFLSFKRCPNLWNLGARPTMLLEDAMALIEDVITCVNVYVSNPDRHKKVAGTNSNEIYIQAYKELAKYLKHLFVYYNHKLNNIPSNISTSWAWARYFQALQADTTISQVKIITFNYDVWLERVLSHLGIQFELGLMDRKPGAKFVISKPHGSISFCHKQKLDATAFEISKTSDIIDGSIGDFTVDYSNLDANFLTDALIPPAGEAGRFKHSWAGQIRLEGTGWMKQLKLGDELILSGLSYWHVDRAELDELLTNVNRAVDVRMINPSPSRTMNAVLTSLFDNYVLYNTTEVLGDLAR
jgi:hypothetical protein